MTKRSVKNETMEKRTAESTLAAVWSWNSTKLGRVRRTAWTTAGIPCACLKKWKKVVGTTSEIAYGIHSAAENLPRFLLAVTGKLRIGMFET